MFPCSFYFRGLYRTVLILRQQLGLHVQEVSYYISYFWAEFHRLLLGHCFELFCLFVYFSSLHTEKFVQILSKVSSWILKVAQTSNIDSINLFNYLIFPHFFPFITSLVFCPLFFVYFPLSTLFYGNVVAFCFCFVFRGYQDYIHQCSRDRLV